MQPVCSGGGHAQAVEVPGIGMSATGRSVSLGELEGRRLRRPPCTGSGSTSAAPSPISSRSTDGAAHRQGALDTEDPSDRVIGGARAARRGARPRRRALLEQTEPIVHGTTVATNALLERKGARTGAADDRGPPRRARDARGPQGRPLRPPPAAARAAGAAPAPPRRARADARRRPHRDAAGSGLARRGARRCWPRDEVEAVAICYLHAWRDGRHERLTAEARAGGAAARPIVALSCEVLPQIKEYERVCTTVVNAYVGPALERYLLRLETRLRAGRFTGPVADHPVARRRRDHRRCERVSPPAPCFRAPPAGSPAAATPRA